MLIQKQALVICNKRELHKPRSNINLKKDKTLVYPSRHADYLQNIIYIH